MKLSKGVTQERQRGVPVSKSRPAMTDFQLEGVWLRLARGAWIGFLLVELLVFILTLVATRGQGLTICPFIVSCDVTPATAQALNRLSIAPSSYTTYNLVLGLLQSLVFLSVGGFIFWRKSSEPVGLVASFFLVSIGLSPFFPRTTYPPEIILSNIYGLCIFTALGYFLVTFPDGHFVPRWSWLLVVLWLVQAIFNEIPGPYNVNSWPPLLNTAQVLLTFGGSLGVLIYRYVRVFSSSRRQQAKWLLFGFGGVFVLVILYVLIGNLVPGLGAPDSPYQLANGTLSTLVFLFVPLSVGIAILRARLWDIDVIIRRTLVYSTLTVILALLYVGLVIGLESLVRLFTGQVSQSPVIIVASTLAIAALFQPLRHRIQRVIDRRFYRSKYDTAKTLASFSATLRNEVDLDQLREQLLAVVQEAMQPAHASLWLQQYGRQAQQQYALVTAEQAASRQPSSPIRETDMADTSQELPRPPSSGISRRAVIIGLATGGIALAGGVLGQWLLRHYPIFIYTGHTGAVFDAVWSPNGKRLASGSADKTVQVWDAIDGSHVFTYRGHTADVYTVAWSPDGKRIASCSKDKTAQVWDASDGSYVFTYRGHKDQVIFVAWSPDGTRLASGGGNPDGTNKTSDPTVQVWDAVDGGHVFTYRGHTDTVFAIAWSPDGKRIASGSGDKTVQVWNAADGGHVFTYTGHIDWVNAVVWSPDGKRIASGSSDWTAQVWDAANGGHVFVYNGHAGAVITAAWSPDGKRIASSSFDDTVQIWSPG